MAWFLLGVALALASDAPDLDGDGHLAGPDCQDDDAAVHPDATERCNGVDDDCNGLVDDAPSDPPARWADRDGDGFGDPASPATVCLPGAAYVLDASDCDDLSPVAAPGLPEQVDGRDNDCDGSIDEDAVGSGSWYADLDGDGRGAGPAETADAAPAGKVPFAGDCDDGDPARAPGTDERCNLVDDDCDGLVDEDPHDPTWWFFDRDGDAAGSPIAAGWACTAFAGTVSVAGDCDDVRADVGPYAAEACDERDNDCNGQIDEAGALGEDVWPVDDDGDGYGSPIDQDVGCLGPGLVDNDDDCDDARPDVHPGGTEVCDEADQDCDGMTDEGIEGGLWYGDADGDGWGNEADPRTECLGPDGSVATAGDCDDADASIHPFAPESCDGLDHDCDGEVLESASTDAFVIVVDADGDGFAHPTARWTSCDPGIDLPATDCDDADAATHPDADEVCDRADNDCDTYIDEGAVDALVWHPDRDADGHGDPEEGTLACGEVADSVPNGDDCDDLDPTSYPGNGALNQACGPRGTNPFAARGGCATAPGPAGASLIAAALLVRRRRVVRPADS